jgi:hypothetical protein
MTAAAKSKLVRHWVVWVLLLPSLVLCSYTIFSLLAVLALVSLLLGPLCVAVAIWLYLWKEG